MVTVTQQIRSVSGSFVFRELIGLVQAVDASVLQVGNGTIA